MNLEPDGFYVAPHVFTESECAALSEAITSLGRTRPGARNLLSIPLVSRAANDERLLTLARAVVGSGAIPFRATLFAKTSRSNWLVAWHQDTSLPMARRQQAQGWGPWSVKAGVLHARAPSWALGHVVALRLHFDASHSGNGPLRVIPGSHHAGVLPQSEVIAQAGTARSVPCLVPRGGILAMRPLLIHASSKASSAEPRRVLHIEYAAGLTLAPEVMLAVA